LCQLDNERFPSNFKLKSANETKIKAKQAKNRHLWKQQNMYDIQHVSFVIVNLLFVVAFFLLTLIHPKLQYFTANNSDKSPLSKEL